MKILSSLILLLLTSLLVVVVYGSGQLTKSELSRDDFPSSFVFGAGTSAYQVEGAVAQDGRSPSIWDVFTHQGKMPDHSNADITCDGYHKYKEDVKLMSDIGLEAYRFSISWSRLLPCMIRGDINPKGLEYYNNLIDELLNHGIEPHVTLYHSDHPQILEEEYGGWLSPRIIKDFTAYADVCFKEFGDRVSHWTTVNEPNILSIASYESGEWPPQRCSQPGGVYNCTAGNSSVEPYIAMHHMLLAHASVVALYRGKYQAKQKGLIGMNAYAFWFAPLTNSTADIEATQRAIDFYIGWAVNPLLYGDYPKIMKRNVGSRLPSFTKHESELVKGSIDFIGLNHYFILHVQDDSWDTLKTGLRDFSSDMGAKTSVRKDGLRNPSGLYNLLEYFKNNYGNPPVYIQENGLGAGDNETLNDTGRIKYISGFMESILDAIRSGSNARGYFVWSLLDVFEFLDGYQKRYGLVHVDFEDKELKRQPKLSAHWYSNFIKQNVMKRRGPSKLYHLTQ